MMSKSVVPIISAILVLLISQNASCLDVTRDQIAQESDPGKAYSHVSVVRSPQVASSKSELQKYGEKIKKSQFNNSSSINLDNRKYKSIDHKPNITYAYTNKFSQTTVHTTSLPTGLDDIPLTAPKPYKKPKTIPDLSGWLTVIPLEGFDSNQRPRHGLFRIGQFQNGQYYLKPIKKPGPIIPTSNDSSYIKNKRRLKPRIIKKVHSSHFSADSVPQESRIIKFVRPRDSKGSDSRRVVYKTKIKHHHHHHHHKYLKTVIKKVPVEVPVQVFVDKPYPVEKKVPYPVEKIVEKVVEKKVPIKIEKKVPYPVKIKVPEPYPVKVIQKEYVPKPYPVIKHVPIVKEVKIEVPVHHPVPYPVEKKVPYPVTVKVPYAVEKKVLYPVEVEVEKKVPYPVKVYVPQPYPVEKKVPYPVEVKVKEPYPVVKHIPVPIKVYVEKPYKLDVEKRNPFPIEAERRIPIPVKAYAPEHRQHEDSLGLRKPTHHNFGFFHNR